jgi:hypothetical protein
MTEHEIALTRSVLAHAYWNKLTPEEATALNNLYYACELLRERARTAKEEGRQEERAAVVAWLRSMTQPWNPSTMAYSIELNEHNRRMDEP